MIRIKQVIYSGGACPYQLEAITDDDKTIYLRYRGGYLRYGYVEKGDIVPKQYIFSKQIGDEYDGGPDDEMFKSVLSDKIVFPKDFNFSIDTLETQ